MKMYAPENTGSISARGISFVVGTDGTVDVPSDVAAELVAFGFSSSPLSPIKVDGRTKAAKDKRRAAAELARTEAAAALFEVEGRGNVEAVQAAKAALDAAEADLKGLGE